MAQPAINNLDQAIEAVLQWKATRMLRRPYYQSLGLKLNSPAEQQAFQAGAVDAMVFDVAEMLGFNQTTPHHKDWTSYAVRKAFLKNLKGKGFLNHLSIDD